MPRPQKCRRVCALPDSEGFVPVRKACHAQTVVLSVDEYEVIRLIDLNGLTQEQCALQMDVARTTVTNIYDSARQKIADAIVNQKRLNIEGGNYRICDGRGKGCGGHSCRGLRCCEERGREELEQADDPKHGDV
jgi:predicted DNA-binding protein (UPF0251 family)